MQQELSKLRARVAEEGSEPACNSWAFLRYNKEGWPRGPFRRNDILVPLKEESVDLWRGVDWEYIDRIVKKPV